MKLRVWQGLALLSLFACAERDEVVHTKQQAIELARAEWGQAFVGDRELEAERVDDMWGVSREWRSGDATEEAIFIEARTGALRRHSTKVMEIDVPK